MVPVALLLLLLLLRTAHRKGTDAVTCPTAPNIVFVMTDQFRADFTAGEGFGLDTMPFLDSLAMRRHAVPAGVHDRARVRARAHQRADRAVAQRAPGAAELHAAGGGAGRRPARCARRCRVPALLRREDAHVPGAEGVLRRLLRSLLAREWPRRDRRAAGLRALDAVHRPRPDDGGDAVPGGAAVRAPDRVRRDRADLRTGPGEAVLLVDLHARAAQPVPGAGAVLLALRRGRGRRRGRAGPMPRSARAGPTSGCGSWWRRSGPGTTGSGGGIAPRTAGCCGSSTTNCAASSTI